MVFRKQGGSKSKHGIFISKRKYTFDLLKETDKLGCKPVGTLMEINWKWKETGKDDPVDRRKYQSFVGKLIYLSLTRPNVAFALNIVSQFMH